MLLVISLLTLSMNAELKSLLILAHYVVRWVGLVLRLKQYLKFVFQSYVIINRFINPLYGCGVKITLNMVR